jgi:hypothetical protein
MGILIYRSRGGHSHCLLLRWTLIVAWIISTARRRHYHCLLYRWTSVVAGIISTTRRDQYHFLLYRWTSVVTEIISTTRRDQYHLLLQWEWPPRDLYISIPIYNWLLCVFDSTVKSGNDHDVLFWESHLQLILVPVHRYSKQWERPLHVVLVIPATPQSWLQHDMLVLVHRYNKQW